MSQALGGPREEDYASLDAPKPIGRHASVVIGVDIGGKGTKTLIVAEDGRKGESFISTFQRSDDMSIGERADGLADSTFKAIAEAAGKAGVGISEIDALGFGAPGARNPRTGGFRMPNAIGTNADGILEEVDLEGLLRERLEKEGFRRDAVIRGGNDCDVAAAAQDLGKSVVVHEGAGDGNMLEGSEESFFILLGTGIGGGWANKDGINEGATGAMEVGHAEVHTPLTWLRCGCGKPNDGSVCIEAVSSTTGQERIIKHLVREAFAGGEPLKEDEMKILLTKTQEWNRKKLGQDVSAEEGRRLEESIASIDSILGGLGRQQPGDVMGLVDDIVFDAGTVDSLAGGAHPQVELAAKAMEITGEHFGRYLRSAIMLRNPKRIVIGGGGGKTFRYGDAETNPFWRAMNAELYDPFGSCEQTWIVAAVGDKNLGIEGSMHFARLQYEQGA